MLSTVGYYSALGFLLLSTFASICPPGKSIICLTICRSPNLLFSIHATSLKYRSLSTYPKREATGDRLLCIWGKRTHL